MSLRTIVTACSMILATSSLQAANTPKLGSSFEVKEITSIFIDDTYRQLKVNTFKNRYVVALEKPCTALRRSDIAFDDISSGILSAGSELQVGTHNCKIKSVRRDLDLLKTERNHYTLFPRDTLTGPNESRSHR